MKTCFSYICLWFWGSGGHSGANQRVPGRVTSTKEALDLVWVWALFSLIAHICAVVGTLVYTGFVRNALTMPTVLTLGIGLFGGAVVATAKCSFMHVGFPADSTENVLYNLSIIFQVFGAASIVGNALVASGKQGGI